MRAKKWVIFVLAGTAVCLSMVASLNYIIDPCFHFRGPEKRIYYYLDSDYERYQNDGILKHFVYDAMITGTSMSANFKASEFDELFGVHSVKTQYSASSYKEHCSAIETAIRSGNPLKVVVCSADMSRLVVDPEYMAYSSYPEFLYDDNPWNDVNYLLNFDVAGGLTARTLWNAMIGRTTTSFDEYANWTDDAVFGLKEVLKYIEHPVPKGGPVSLSEKDRGLARENVRKNILTVVESNPDIEFYYFIPPYSVAYWYPIVRKGELQREIECHRLLIEELLPYENCHLFSWSDRAEIVCNLDQYRDTTHYSEEINAQMLEWMSRDEGWLTKENYEDYLSRIEDLYGNYDYDALFE